MREEIAAAVVFVSRLIKVNECIPKAKVDEFSNVLSSILIDKFKSHWYTDAPTKGQGYRCIRINPAEPVDKVLEKAANHCGLNYSDLNLPQELTLWVDPKEVCCRFGESQGSYCQLAVLREDGGLENQAATIDLADHLNAARHRANQNVNIVATRTSASKLKAMALRNATYQSQLRSSYQHNAKYQQNLYNNNNQQQPPPPTSSANYPPRPFHHKAHHQKNNYHNNQSESSYGYQGKGGNGYQNKDRFHWVRNNNSNKQSYSPPQQQQEVEQMRLSPN